MNDKVTELETRLATLADDAGQTPLERIDLLNELSWELSRIDVSRACALGDEARQLAADCGYTKGLAYALRNQGICHWLRADYPAALTNFLEALHLLESTGDTDGAGTILNNIGSVYYRIGDYAEALDCYFKSLKIKQAGGDRQNESKTLNNIGGVYENLGDYANALAYYQRSLKIKEEIGDRRGAAYTLSNIGAVHQSLGDFDKALECQLDSMKILEAAEDKFGHAAALQGAGSACEKLADYERALLYYRQSLEIRERVGDREGMAATLLNLGTCHLEQGKGPEALAHLERARAVAAEIGSRTLCYQVHQALSDAYDSAGDYASALGHYRTFHQLKEEVFNSEADTRITSLVTRLEVERAEREAEVYRLKTVELAQANQSLQEAGEQKSHLVEQLRRQTLELDRQTKEDSLTGLSNRRHLDAQLAQEFARARRFTRELTVVMADLDNFKTINDRFSHQLGDEVLRRVARILRDNCRAIDMVARYGGEEFALVLIETSPEQAALLCERLRAAIEGYQWEALAPGLKVTISMGLVGDKGVASHEGLLAGADTKLYHAKQGGRNQVRY